VNEDSFFLKSCSAAAGQLFLELLLFMVYIGSTTVAPV
jgi:hypothetical protein